MLGVSIDSVHAHRAWANILGGIEFPLLADFHPKGAVAQAYGVWRPELGFSRRAVFIIDPQGVVRHVDVIPKGPPNTQAILADIDSIKEG